MSFEHWSRCSHFLSCQYTLLDSAFSGPFLSSSLSLSIRIDFFLQCRQFGILPIIQVFIFTPRYHNITVIMSRFNTGGRHDGGY